jgi:hypothetical protein
MICLTRTTETGGLHAGSLIPSFFNRCSELAGPGHFARYAC